MPSRPTAIIIVEDDANLRTMYLDLLDHFGYQVVAYSSAEEALAGIAHDSMSPDLILLDFKLPGMDGNAFLQQLQFQVKRAIPVIVLTALSEDELGIQEIQKHPWVRVVLRKTTASMHQLLETIRSTLDTLHKDLTLKKSPVA